jgi:hypothetical protein
MTTTSVASRRGWSCSAGWAPSPTAPGWAERTISRARGSTGFADATHDPALLDRVRTAFPAGFHTTDLADVVIMLTVLLLRVVPRRGPVPAAKAALSSESQR